MLRVCIRYVCPDLPVFKFFTYLTLYGLYGNEVFKIIRYLIDSRNVSQSGSNINEDAVAVSEKFIAVIDGATGLNDNNYMMFGTDAGWFAHRTAEILAEKLSDTEKSLPDILRSAMDILRAEWKGNESDMPSCGISIFRINMDKIEYFGLGDCYASALFNNGDFLKWTETALTGLDEKALSKMCYLAKTKGISMYDARKEISELLIKHRSMRNTEGGYWCLDPSGIGIPHARQAVFSAEDCRSLFLCSDGFYQLAGFNYYKSLRKLHEASETNELDDLINILFTLQEKDYEMERLPRFKFRDDSSAVIGKIRRIWEDE